MTPVTFYRPVSGGSYRAVPMDAKVVQRGRGDFEQLGVRVPGGEIMITTYADVGVKQGWYVETLGQQFRVSGISPVPPRGIMVNIECDRNTEAIRIEERVSVMGEEVAAQGEELAVTGKPRRIGE